ncbi:MAG: metallophosphoesterase [Clostridiales bacterium]|nr:metallophosphoesterase [Clostridiales bacterium]
MFLSDNIPIVHECPSEWKSATLYFIHDLHFGSELFDAKKWQAFKQQIMEDDHALVFWIGDLMENAIPDSKSDVFTQSVPPVAQKEFVTRQLTDLADKTVAVVPGNHEHNRTTAKCGLYPLYDCCLIAGISEKYRDIYAICDIGIGQTKKNHNLKYRYVVQIQHRAKDIKSCNSADFTDGIDIFAYGHDHDPKDHPRKKIVYDAKRKSTYQRNVEVIDCGSFCTYGGYGARGAYRPQSDKLYRLKIGGDARYIETTGFYV